MGGVLNFLVNKKWRGRKKGKSKFSFSKLFLPYLKWLLWGIRKRLVRVQESVTTPHCS